MSVLIKGLDMPKKELNKEGISVTIWADGRVTNDGYWVLDVDGSYRREYCNDTQGSAIELPPHGRLTDADAICAECRNSAEEYDGIYPDCNYCIAHGAPTIIEAEEETEDGTR